MTPSFATEGLCARAEPRTQFVRTASHYLHIANCTHVHGALYITCPTGLACLHGNFVLFLSIDYTCMTHVTDYLWQDWVCDEAKEAIARFAPWSCVRKITVPAPVVNYNLPSCILEKTVPNQPSTGKLCSNYLLRWRHSIPDSTHCRRLIVHLFDLTKLAHITFQTLASGIQFRFVYIIFIST